MRYYKLYKRYKLYYQKTNLTILFSIYFSSLPKGRELFGRPAFCRRNVKKNRILRKSFGKISLKSILPICSRISCSCRSFCPRLTCLFSRSYSLSNLERRARYQGLNSSSKLQTPLIVFQTTKNLWNQSEIKAVWRPTWKAGIPFENKETVRYVDEYALGNIPPIKKSKNKSTKKGQKKQSHINEKQFIELIMWS